MALKDWKKTDDTIEKIRYVNRKDGRIVFVHNLKKGFYKRNYIGVEVMGADTKNILSKSFKTKSQALKFAKEYMRRN